MHVEPLVLLHRLYSMQKYPVEGVGFGVGLDQQASRVAGGRRNFSLIFTKMPNGQWIPASLFQNLLGLRQKHALVKSNVEVMLTWLSIVCSLPTCLE